LAFAFPALAAANSTEHVYLTRSGHLHATPLLKYESNASTYGKEATRENEIEREPELPSTPLNPQYDLSNLQPWGAPHSIDQPSGPVPFVFLRNDSLSWGDTGIPDLIAEPSAATLEGGLVFVTGNTFASYSTNGGATYTKILPALYFPEVNGGFCCDQVVQYNRPRHALFWVLQYTHDGVTNTQRLAIAKSMDQVVNKTWRIVDLQPSSFALGDGYWLDFPDLTCSDNYLYLTTNVANVSNEVVVASVIARFPLNELINGLPLTYQYYVFWDRFSHRCTLGAHSVMYFGTHNSNSSFRVYSWDEASTSFVSHDVSHVAYSTGPYSAPGNGGGNWTGRMKDKVLGAYTTGPVVVKGFMWTAAQAGGFPFPYVVVLKLNQLDQVLSETAFYSTTHAWAYPSACPNDDNVIGGTLAFGGGDQFPGTAAWVDDNNPSTFSPATMAFATGRYYPGSGDWGDFFDTRISANNPKSWVAAGYSLTGSAYDVAIRRVWFARTGQVGTPLQEPSSITLSCSPNPALGYTNIDFVASREGTFNLSIFNVKGERIRDLFNEMLSKGPHAFKWDGTDSRGRLVPHGVYYLHLEGPEMSARQAVVLIE